MVAPSGIETAKVFLRKPSFSHNLRFTGIFAAELLVKKAVMPLSLKAMSTIGYGFLLVFNQTIRGLIRKAMTSMDPTKMDNNLI